MILVTGSEDFIGSTAMNCGLTMVMKMDPNRAYNEM